MECQEAQAMIVPFIEGRLDDEQTERFIEHVEQCSDCYDELEVYYIVMVGVKQLDEENDPIVDFNGDLKKYIAYKKEELNKKHMRSVRLRTGSLIFVAALLALLIFLGYSAYSHPDLTARYQVKVIRALGFEPDVPLGKIGWSVPPVTGNIWFESVEMPLQRVNIDKKGNMITDESSTD